MKPAAVVRYCLEVIIDVPILTYLDGDEDASYTPPPPNERRRIERMVVRACHQIDGDVHAEVMSVELVEEDA